MVYGLSCPMDFPINIFIHPSIHPLDYGRFVPMHFRSRERNDHSECSFPGTNVWTFRSRNETAYSINFRALERLCEPNEEKE